MNHKGSNCISSILRQFSHHKYLLRLNGIQSDNVKSSLIIREVRDIVSSIRMEKRKEKDITLRYDVGSIDPFGRDLIFTRHF